MLLVVRVTVLAAAALSAGGSTSASATAPAPAPVPSCIHALGGVSPAVYLPTTCPAPGGAPHPEGTWCTVPVGTAGLPACAPPRPLHYVTVPAGR